MTYPSAVGLPRRCLGNRRSDRLLPAMRRRASAPELCGVSGVAREFRSTGAARARIVPPGLADDYPRRCRMPAIAPGHATAAAA